MSKNLIVAALLTILPSTAFAQSQGGGTDMMRVNREVDAMIRDGRWDRLIAEGRANKQAFDDLRAREATGVAAPASGQLQDRRRRR